MRNEPDHHLLKPLISTGRWMILVYAIGLYGTHIYFPPNILTGYQRLADSFSQSFEWVHASEESIFWMIIAACGAVGCLPLTDRWPRSVRLIGLSAVFVSACQGAALLAETFGPQTFCPLALGENVTKCALPALLGFAIWRMADDSNFDQAKVTADQCLRLGCIATSVAFLIHGIYALCNHPPFADIITESARRVISLGIPKSLARNLLLLIGVFNISLSILVYTRFRPISLRIMYIWGFITAWSRVTAEPFSQAWNEPLIRIADGGLPLLMLLIIRQQALHFQHTASLRIIPQTDS